MTPAGVTLQERFDVYERSHRHPLNRACHALGIPLILASLPLFLFHWPLALALFLGGWAFQLVGHFVFERNLPEFFRSPVYLAVGPLYFVRKLLRREAPPSPRTGSPPGRPRGR